MIASRDRQLQPPTWGTSRILERVAGSQVSNAARLVWHWREVMTNLLSDKQHIVLSRLHAAFGDRFRVHLGFHTVVVLADPTAVKQVLDSDSKLMSAGAGRKRLVGMFPRESLFYTEGDKHKQLRPVISRAFGEASKSFDLEVQLQKLVRKVENANAVDPYELICDQLIKITSKFVIGYAKPEVCSFAQDMLSCFSKINNAAIVFPPLRNTRHFGNGLRNYQTAQSAFVEYIQQQIDNPDGYTAESLIGAFMRKQEAGHLTAEEVRDNAAFLFLVISRTLISLFTNIAQTLSVETTWQNRLREDDSASVQKMKLLRATAKETMRLIPFAPMFARVATADQEIDGFHVNKGELILIPPSIIHLRESAFPDPLRFDPTRFVGRKQHGYNYLPFGGGRHHCIGSGWLVDVVASFYKHLIPKFEFLSEASHPQDGDYSMRAVFLLPRSRTFSIRRIQQTTPSKSPFLPTESPLSGNMGAV